MKTAYIDCTAFGHALLQEQRLGDKIPGMIVNVGDPDAATLAHLLDGTQGILNGHTFMDEALLARCHDLETIVFLGTGASSYIDVAAAKRQGIEVLTIRGYGNRTNAEHAFALMLCASRNVAAMDRSIRAGSWVVEPGMELAGKRLGVVGVGGVGSEMIKMAHAFGMEVVAWNRSAVSSALPCRQLPLDELMRTSDVVSLHLAMNEATRGFIGKEQLSLMKPDAIFVNVARGGLVDEDALIDCLKQKKIRHAALDVFAQEPLLADNELGRLENVTLTAHAAFSSKEAMSRLLADGFDALAKALAPK